MSTDMMRDPTSQALIAPADPRDEQIEVLSGQVACLQRESGANRKLLRFLVDQVQRQSPRVDLDLSKLMSELEQSHPFSPLCACDDCNDQVQEAVQRR